MRPYLFFKRILDIFFSLILIILLFPIMLVISILIRIDSKGPAVFVQTRVGHGKKEFRMYKFRTMRVGAEKLQKSLMRENEAHFPAFKIKNDPRLTAFGKKLRKTGLDELPQLWNILKGEMSFVGFRPPLPEEVEHYKKWHMKRFSGIPGILSFWAIDGEHNLTFDEWIKLDIKYDSGICFAYDFRVVMTYVSRFFFRFISRIIRFIFFILSSIIVLIFRVIKAIISFFLKLLKNIFKKINLFERKVLLFFFLKIFRKITLFIRRYISKARLRRK